MYKISEYKTMEIKTSKNKDGMLIFDNYEEYRELFTQLLEITNTAIVDDEFYKEAKKFRAEINKVGKNLSAIKTSFLKDYVYDYDTKSKEISKIVKEISETIDSKIKSLEEENNILKPAMIHVVFKTFDQKKAEELIALGKTIGMKGEIE